jgi:hypothetical protein
MSRSDEFRPIQASGVTKKSDVVGVRPGEPNEKQGERNPTRVRHARWSLTAAREHGVKLGGSNVAEAAKVGAAKNKSNAIQSPRTRCLSSARYSRPESPRCVGLPVCSPHAAYRARGHALVARCGE